MIRVSAGTAACLGLTTNRMDAYPATAYLLSGSRCQMNCAFCPQGTDSNEALRRLGRVTWPEYSWTEVEKALTCVEETVIRRICMQSVRHADGIVSLLGQISQIKTTTNLPLSLSAWIRDEDEAAAIFAAGVERISISLDVVNPEDFRRIKGGSLQERLDLLLHCAHRYPGRMSTHLVCGFGETEAEMLSTIDKLLSAEITVALFAFIPLRGTKLENEQPPAVHSYRRVQAGHFLLREKVTDFLTFQFEEGRLVSFGLPGEELKLHLACGTAFQTSGCPDCNRPYYNERPGGIIYNYHHRLSTAENAAIMNEILSSVNI